MSSLKSVKLLCLAVLLVTYYLLLITDSHAADQLTITTYYPSPYGSYRELRAQRMAVGNTYINNSVICWGGAAAGCPGGSADPGAATSLVVEGNVGIGTTNPREKLEIADNFDADFDMLTAISTPSDVSVIHIKKARGTISSPLIVANGDSLAGVDGMGYDGFSYNRAAAIYMTVDGAPALNSVPGAIHISTRSVGDNTSWAGTERMIITSNGNVGIGTSNPQRKLHVLENSLNAAALVGGEQLIIEANDAGMGIYSKRASFGSSHLDLVEINSDGSFSDFWALARVANVSAGHPTADGSFRIYYGTNPSFYAGAGNTAMLTIQKTGNVGIGTTSPDVKLDVDGDIEADLITGAVALGNVGYIAGGVNGGIYKLIRNTSSKKYKENIANFTPGLEIVKKLRPVIFNWKSTGEQDFGFVAEEAEEVNPLLITKINGQVESFRYMPYTAILTNAIKEQQKEIENLKSAVAELSKKLEAKK